MPEIRILLEEMGVKNVEELFKDIPKEARRTLDLPSGLNEYELFKLFSERASENTPSLGNPSFLGGEFQARYIPSAVNYIGSRGELFTAYTSYQPEISQGMLQALFEYQSLMAELTSMDVVNASLYDSGTGLGEALRLASRANRKTHFLLPNNIPETKKSIVDLYTRGINGKIEYYGHEEEGGGLDIEDLRSKITPDTGAVYVEMPNAFGVLDEQILSLKEELGKVLLIVGVDPISLSTITPPGEYGADIVIGEGQPLGLPMGFGGPTLGILGVTKKLARKMPGRVVGVTKDPQDQRAFCITLQTREQHIRREKATSNICSNEALCAVIAGAYMALMGQKGLARLGDLLVERSHKLANEINDIPGFKAPKFSRPFFSSFTVETPVEYEKVHDHLLKNDIQGGAPLSKILPDMKDLALFSVNETIPSEAYARLVEVLVEMKGWGGA